MTTISFYARGDGSSANNSALNVENTSQQPTVQITFNSGPTGDIILDYNGGANDPDTTVTIGGTTYNFAVELTGDLPFGSSKVPDVLEGKQITVISVVIGGNTERFFFVTDGSGTQTLMDQFGNGAIALTSADFAPPPVYICFCRDTEILTPAGLRKVQSLCIGDPVLTDEGKTMPVLWVGRSVATVADMLRDPERRPVCIPADAIAPGVPFADLYVSARHRVAFHGSAAQLYFGEDKVLVAAKHLVGSIAHWALPVAEAGYFHILLERHEMLVSNGLVSESFQPSKRCIEGISGDARRSLAKAVPDYVLQQYCLRPDAAPTLKGYEAVVLAARTMATVRRRSGPDTVQADRRLALAA